MRYRVTGTDEKTRARIELIVHAEDEAGAWRDAKSRGVIVASVEPATDATAGATPPTVRIDPTHIQLIERTGKTWKALFVIGAALFAIGVLAAAWIIARDPRALSRPGAALMLAAVASVAGLALIVAARLGAWWRHG